MSDFEKGDVVVLKSGGLRMIVNAVGSYSSSGGPEDGAICVWFNETLTVQERVFDTSTLKLYEGSLALRRGGSVMAQSVKAG